MTRGPSCQRRQEEEAETEESTLLEVVGPGKRVEVVPPRERTVQSAGTEAISGSGIDELAQAEEAQDPVRRSQTKRNEGAKLRA